MTFHNQDQTAINKTGVDRRTFQRYAVRLDGVCHLKDSTDVGCEIQDVCLGGMYIVFKKTLDEQPNTVLPTPALNDIIQLECFLPAKQQRQTIHVKARVVRCYESGVGIAFNNPELETLQALKGYIDCVPDEQLQTINASSSPDSTHSHSDSIQLINSCKNLLAAQSTPLAKNFLTTIDEQLFAAARDAKNNTEQTVFFDTMGVYKRSKSSFIESFHGALSSQLESLSVQPQNPTAQDTDQPFQSELSLMGDDSFENWLAVKDIINQSQSRHHDLLTELEQRFTTLFKTIVNRDNNPFGPALFAHALEKALPQLELDHKMNLFSYAVFKNVLTDTLQEPYTAINKILEKNGIQPELRTNITQEEQQPQAETKQDTSVSETTSNTTSNENYAGNSSHTKPSTEQASHVNDHNPSNKTQPDANDSGDSTVIDTSKHDQSEQSSVTGPDHQVNEVGDATNTLTAASEQKAARTHIKEGQQNIYQLVQELRQLKQQLNSQTNSGEETESNQEIHHQSIQTTQYTTNELMNALSALQKQGQSTPSTDSVNHDFKSRALNILSEQDSATDNNKQIGDRESNIMDVAGNLFDSLLHDMLVAESVQQWIKKLEIPLLKIALQDDSIFVDKNHVARQVVNKISQLEGYTNNNPHGSQNTIWKKVDNLMDSIADNIDNNPDVFNQALNEIDTLIKVQDKAYGENFQEVINECDREYEAELENNPPQKNNDIKTKNHPQWQPWEKHARRLQIGDWLLFSDTSSNSQRLRLAWIAKNLDRYVFINLKGLKEITLNFEELSQRLRDGTAIVLESASEPALDRAQYSMLGKLHRQLIHESTHDQLTGLINRREFECTLDSKLAQQGEKHCQNVLCYLNIDQFSIVNSTYGHEAGDKLLIEFTDLLLRSLNGQGILAHVGGDAFTLLLENNTAADARQIIQHQIDIFNDYRLQWQDKGLAISLNIGLVPITDFEANAAELLRTAEISCRTAKEKGSNQIHIYQRNDQSMAQHQHIIQQVLQIDDTIENGNIGLLCQRIAPIQSDDINEPHHSEILISIKDDQGNAIPTQDFILAAEHYNRMPAIDRWVIANTFDWMSRHKDLMTDIGGLAINLSGRSLNDESFMNFVLDHIVKSGLPAEWICFEITETAGIANLSDATVFIEKLKDTGCHFSLDDFGSGLSSYAYLKNLPVDYLKIDGAFVKEMHENPNDYAVVKSICEIGHFMGKKIIAEFVENETILEQLRDIGVDYVQGYAIDKPKPLNDLTLGKTIH